MRRRTAIGIAIIAVVLLAGCGGATDGTTETQTDEFPTTTVESTPTTTTTVTVAKKTTGAEPTGTPTPVERLGNGSLPPGMATTGITNASRLVNNHQDRVRSQGYAAKTNVVWATSETTLRTTSRERWGRDGTFSIETTSSSGTVEDRRTVYSDGSTTFVRTALENGTADSALDRGFFAAKFNESPTLTGFVALGEFDVTDVVTDEESTLVTLEASTPKNTSSPDVRPAMTTLPPLDRISDLKATMVVDLDGRIHALDMEFDLSAEDASAEGTVVLEYRLEEPDVATVDSPSWIETARHRATRADLTIERRDETVEITHRGGDAIPRNATISLVETNPVSANTTMLKATFNSTLEPGETAYFYRPEGAGSFEGRMVVGHSPGENHGPLPDAFTLKIEQAGEILAATIVSTNKTGEDPTAGRRAYHNR